MISLKALAVPFEVSENNKKCQCGSDPLLPGCFHLGVAVMLEMPSLDKKGPFQGESFGLLGFY